MIKDAPVSLHSLASLECWPVIVLAAFNLDVFAQQRPVTAVEVGRDSRALCHQT